MQFRNFENRSTELFKSFFSFCDLFVDYVNYSRFYCFEYAKTEYASRLRFVEN